LLAGLVASACHEAAPANDQTQAVAKPAGISLPAPVPPKEGAAVTGVYRNLFVDMGKSADEVKQKIDAAYKQLFHGEPGQQAVMFAGKDNEFGPTAYIMDIGHNDVRSEGMSYGMMIALQLDQKADFDALWNWAKTYMYHADEHHPAFGYFSWQMRPDGTAIDEMPAPDGEEYFATALLFAANRWGNGKDRFDYAQEANALLSRMKNRGPITGTVNGNTTATGVSLFNTEVKMVRFTPNSGNFEVNKDHTDPSYHLPAFYEIWALQGPEADRQFWADAAKTSRDYFVKATHPKTGLAPDYAHFDGSPKAASWDANSVDFRFDAWRTVMNWSMDAAWWAKDPRETELSNRLVTFFASFGKYYPNTYKIDGTPTSQSSSSGLYSMNAVAALAASDANAWQFVETLYKQSVPTGQWRYYDGLLYLLAMLNVSGAYHAYLPAH
jgi:oligosaccharide reducing-end xylanase